MARTSQLGRGLGCPAVEMEIAGWGGVLHVEKKGLYEIKIQKVQTHIIMIVRGAPCCQAASASRTSRRLSQL